MDRIVAERDDARMTRSPVLNRHHQPIASVDEWGRLAAPAGKNHWQDGRSAKELARAWIEGDGAGALRHLLDRHEGTSGLEIECAIAEAQTSFDEWPGGRRNHDLLVRGQAASGALVVGLEAKADETFGQTVDGYFRAAAAKRKDKKPTNAPQRLEGLLAAVTGSSVADRPELGALRYQLFSGLAGTLAAAQEGESAAFVVHELKTSKTTASKRAANAKALSSFVVTVFGPEVPQEEWWLLGPFQVPGEKWSSIPLWIGHLTTAPGEKSNSAK